MQGLVLSRLVEEVMAPGVSFVKVVELKQEDKDLKQLTVPSQNLFLVLS